MRAVVNVEEIQGRTCLVVTELPYQVNPDNLAMKIADLVKDGKIAGIADIRDETSGRTGQRLVIVLKRDAVAKVVLNNLYKHTAAAGELRREHAGDRRRRAAHPAASTRSSGTGSTTRSRSSSGAPRSACARPRRMPTSCAAYLKALDALDEVIALIRALPTVEDAREGLMELLDIDELQAQRDPGHAAAPPGRPGAPEDHRPAREARGRDRRVQGDPRPRRAGSADHLSEELAEIVAQVRRRPAHRDHDRATTATCRVEDLIPEEEMVVTITRGGYVKRTRSDNYRSPAPRRQGGQGRAAARRRRRRALLRHDDAPLAAVLHQPGPGLPGQGVRAAPRPAATPRASTSPTCSPSSRTSRSPRSSTSATTSRRRTWCWPPSAAWSRRPG